LRFGAMIVGLGFALTACSGVRGTSALPASGTGVSGAGAVSHNAAGTLVLSLPPILSPSAMPTPGRTQLLSSGTRSISGEFGTHAIAPIALAATTPGCARQTNGLVCTLHVRLPSGSAPLKLQTFGKANGSGLPLATSLQVSVRVDPGVDNYPAPGAWKSIASAVRVTVDPPEVTVVVGKDQRDAVVTGFAVDASGSLAPNEPVLPDGTRPALELVQTGFEGSTIPFSGFVRHVIGFNGQKSGKLTFTVSQNSKSPVLQPASAGLTVRAKPGVPGLGSTIVATGDQVPMFPAGATGAAEPLRTLFDVRVSAPYGADARGDFWMSNNHFSNTGALLGSIKLPGDDVLTATTTDAAGNVYALLSDQQNEGSPCNNHYWIVEYASGDYSGKAIRQIVYPVHCAGTAITLDASGFIYTYEPPDGVFATGKVSKWPAKTSGNVQPLTTFQVPALSSMMADAAGDLFAVHQAARNAPAGTLIKFTAGSWARQPVLPNISVAAFTMDTAANVYAEVPTSPTAFEIEKFAPGSTTPSNTLTSSSLTTPMGITVVP
jgi:hypothetical protein